MSRKTIYSLLVCLLCLQPTLTQAQSLTQYEYWFDDDPKACAEMYVENILTEFRENYNQNSYDLVSENKDEIINVMTEYIADWIA